MSRWPDRSLADRVWEKVAVADIGCWEWLACRDQGGYGLVNVGGAAGRAHKAHRVVYELTGGIIPEGLTLDHLCNNPGCVRPDHLEPVSNAENVRRRFGGNTHCSKGHPFDEENTYYRKDRPGRRQCKACQRIQRRNDLSTERVRRWRARRAAER